MVQKKNKLIIFDVDDTLIHKGQNYYELKKGLVKLKDKYYIVVLSNSCYKKTVFNLKSYGFYSYFDGVYSRSYFFNRKPLPFKYKDILSDFNVLKANVTAVGDKLYTDILGANLFGIKSILVNNREDFVSKVLKTFFVPNNEYKNVLEFIGGL